MLKRVFLVIALCGFVLSLAFAQSAPAVKFRVALRISGDSGIASQIEGCVKQELGSLNDVDLSDTRPDYTINIIAMEIDDKGQVPIGIALTWLSLYHPKGFFEDCSLVEDYRLLTLDKEDIQSNCRKLVARFDARSLEPHRKIFQKTKP